MSSNPAPNPAPNPANPAKTVVPFAPVPAPRPARGGDPAPQPSSPQPSTVDPGKAADWVHNDLRTAARLLYCAAATARRSSWSAAADQAEAIERVRADLVAVLAGEDTPSEIRYGDLAADASAYADEVEKLREELEETRGPRVHGKGI